MVSFVNIETGNIFNGNSPYIFWFGDGCSVDLQYSQHICFISNKKYHVITINDNDVFKLVDSNSLRTSFDEELNSFKYKNISDICCGTTMSTGTKYEDYYIHNIYFIASYSNAGEFVEEFKIDDDSFKLGIDLYSDNEELRINLSNFGIEFSDSIQKAIYSNNIHEDYIDNILLNRKFKELLSNYWDIIANKGSYKSLINSLKWFEWGDYTRLKEIWKTHKNGKDVYVDKDINTILDTELSNSILRYSKTTYIALYTALHKLTGGYDDEKNPEIENVVFDWSIEDMALKMSMLGAFYEAYFMPIHLDLIHSTIESVVFTNTIKVIKGCMINRTDLIGSFDTVMCSISDDDVFRLDNVEVQVDNETMLGQKYDGVTKYSVGVRRLVPMVVNESELKTFYTQNYTGVGVMVPVTMYVPLCEGDVIKKVELTFIPDGESEWVTKTYNMIHNDRYFEFNLLCTQERTYELRMSFTTIMSNTYSKKIVFNTVDTKSMRLDLYKVEWNDKVEVNDINNMFVRFGNDLKYYKQTIKFDEKSGPKTNHILIIKDNIPHDKDKWISKNYYTTLKIPYTDTVYTVCVSKKYGFTPKTGLDPYKDMIYRSDYGFFPQLHRLDPFGGDKLEDYIVYNDLLCIIPQFRFGLKINSCEWEFINVSTNKHYRMDGSVQTPFILSCGGKELDPGYYNIIFRFSFVNGTTHEFKLNSAFIKK